MILDVNVAFAHDVLDFVNAGLQFPTLEDRWVGLGGVVGHYCR